MLFVLQKSDFKQRLLYIIYSEFQQFDCPTGTISEMFKWAKMERTSYQDSVV